MLTPERLALTRSFVEVAEARSYRVAARTLRITGSTLSRRIAMLEEQLSVQLLFRTTRKVALTEAGAHYLEACRKALATIESAETEVTGLSAAPRGRLCISAPVGFGRIWLGPMVPRLLEAHPELEIDLRLDDAMVNLVDAQVDIAVRVGTLKDSGLVGRKIMSIPRLLAASPAYLKAHGTPRRIADLQKHRCLHFTPYQTGELWHLTEQGRTKRVRVTGPFRTNHLETLVEATVAGAGIGLIGELLAGPLLASGALVRVLPRVRGPMSDGWLVHLPGAQRRAAVRAGLDFLTQNIREVLPL